ncbi:MAG: choice-of-anchor I family protein [Lacibacter sp.]
MRKIFLLLFAASVYACTKQPEATNSLQDLPIAARVANLSESTTFEEISSIKIGNLGAAEISAFDPATKKLFVVNNSSGNNRIDVLDLSNPFAPYLLGAINTQIFGGFVNSVAVSKGKLAAGIEAADKVSPGKVVVFTTTDYAVLAEVTVGSLPDMVTFSPDGNFILSANEGEPNDAYTIDPVGSVSIIEVNNNYQVTTLDFSKFAANEAELKAKGLRIFGKNASFAQDIEPEYITVSENSKTAWVTLQENNAFAEIDLVAKSIVQIHPMGFKDYNSPQNTIDPSDQDGGIFFNSWPVKGIYQPDAIAVMSHNNVPFVFTANEGDAREWTGFSEIRRINNSAIVLDPQAFPNAATLKANAQLGRLNITTTLGDTDGDGDFDALYSYGARSFSIWHGRTGKLIYDSRDFIDKTAAALGKYPDNRSDDKGCEPEGLAIGRVGNNNLLFVGLERGNAVMVYDVTNPVKPRYLQWLNTGVGPEGVLFVPAPDSPIRKSLLIVSSETDGFVKIYTTR